MKELISLSVGPFREYSDPDYIVSPGRFDFRGHWVTTMFSKYTFLYNVSGVSCCLQTHVLVHYQHNLQILIYIVHLE